MTTKLPQYRKILEAQKRGFQALLHEMELVESMFLHVFSKEDGEQLKEEIAALQRLLERMTQ